jgi:protein-S-isoprenylcysteine O-methyltransferase Ste14
MQSLTTKAIGALLILFAISGALLFLPAWTFDYWQAWVYLAVFSAAISAIVIYLIRNDPELLLRRMNNTEKEKSQKIIHFLVNLAFAFVSIVPALDRRFGWSSVPVYVVMLGDILVVLGMLIIFFVFKENSFTASTIEVASDQKVISTGPYAIVRHPMYAGGLVYIAGIPLALGSWWGLLMVLLFLPIMLWRILDEERFLIKNLSGYAEYRNKVKYRLIRFMW